MHVRQVNVVLKCTEILCSGICSLVVILLCVTVEGSGKFNAPLKYGNANPSRLLRASLRQARKESLRPETSYQRNTILINCETQCRFKTFLNEAGSILNRPLIAITVTQSPCEIKVHGEAVNTQQLRGALASW